MVRGCYSCGPKRGRNAQTAQPTRRANVERAAPLQKRGSSTSKTWTPRRRARFTARSADDVGGGGVNVLRCRTRAPAADEAAGRLRSVPAGAAISLLGAAARIFGVRAQGVGSRAAAAVPSCPRRATRAFPRGAPDRSTRWRRGSLPNPNPNSALGETRRSRAPCHLASRVTCSSTWRYSSSCSSSVRSTSANSQPYP